MGWNGEHGHQRVAFDHGGELLQVERGGLAQVGEGLLDGFTSVVVPVSGLKATYPPSSAGDSTAVSSMGRGSGI
jgi:hypothetical protein